MPILILDKTCPLIDPEFGEIPLIAGLHRLLTHCKNSSVAVKTFRSSERGAVALEYGLIAALVVVVVIVALVQLRTSLIDLPLPSLNSAFEAALS